MADAVLEPWAVLGARLEKGSPHVALGSTALERASRACASTHEMLVHLKSGGGASVSHNACPNKRLVLDRPVLAMPRPDRLRLDVCQALFAPGLVPYSLFLNR
jgi:hypothetical protein